MEFLMKPRLLYVICILTLLCLPNFLEAKKITLTTLDWEPYIGKKLNGNGYVAEVAKEAFKRSGYELEIKFYPWARTKFLAVKGDVDGYFPEYYDEKLKEHSLISEPFQGGPIGFFKRIKNDINYTKLTDLKKYKIGVVRGYVNEKEFDNAKYLKKDEVKDDLTNIKKLLGKRIDLFVADKFVGLYLLKQNFPDKIDKITFIEPPLANNDLFICISKKTKNYQEKMKAFNDGLKAIKKDGTFAKILKKHGF